MALMLLFAGLTISVLGVRFLNSPNMPTGGDTASHVLYAWHYAKELLFSGNILPWMPEVFGGFPFLSYYFPLPFIIIAVLAKGLGFSVAFKWGAFAAAMLLPGLVQVLGRRWFSLPWPASIFGAVGAFAFLLHEQNSIWGGNLLSTLSGEFTYSYGVLFAVLACFAWSRASETRGGWIVAALLEAATGYCHGFPLLVVGFSTVVLLVENSNFRRTAWLLVRGHLLAFCLLGGWLWPMLEMHGYTIANDASWALSSWGDLFPLGLRPVFVAGGVCLPVCLLSERVHAAITSQQARAMRYLMAAAALACLGYLAGEQLGLANIRFFPMVWLFAAIVCGWLVGIVISVLAAGNGRGSLLSRTMLTLALCLGVLGWLAQTVRKAPDWSLWNHAGFESKPQWHNLSKIFPAMHGTLWSPRLVFEHDPTNNDLGSTRALEALPLFIGRPVLEGLYMESALLCPAVYLLQSEVSAQPSSPLVRFPSGRLDPPRAAEHMNFLHADTLLLRSEQAKNAVEASGLFEKTAESPPFAVYRLRNFTSHLAQVVTQPIRVRPQKEWLEDSFAWFRTHNRFQSYLPVYGAPAGLQAAPAATVVRTLSLERHRMHFATDSVGSPHLIKVTWHPRWRLGSAGSLYKAGPGFMLVVPREHDIILEYGHTPIGIAGMAATTLSAAFVIFWQGWGKRQQADASAPVVAGGGFHPIRQAIFWGTVIVAGFWFATQSPEQLYRRAHAKLLAKQYDAATSLFLRSFNGRRIPARKEEALFWLAKSYEQADQKNAAMKRYRQLTGVYDGQWVPENLYAYVRLGREAGQAVQVEPYARRLIDEYPDSSWAKKLIWK
ncbi:6-pyruvoyl-tetrahydropterin synthase-related protein [Geobacter sp. FeAm09]|uniref:6-pyruvoyl-tetrahydropterin synthase-related protein n=1 Tax=Geobacter sp. FeAm09 TaxID=2597769 RepID=UPI00197A8874|nr:6-pyruvoyl-tetrahydropterin synthase-related protein [Geobacter sp. FeAm09]